MSDPTHLPEGDFLRLFVAHEPALRAFARVLLPTWEAVDEVMQEASVVMWRKLSQLDAPENFLPWAKVILRFEALRLRRDYARDRHVFDDAVIALLADEALELGEDVWEQERAALHICLARLATHQRELVLAPYAGEGRVTQLAQETGRSVNSLYKLLGRLREKLVLCVEERLARKAVG